MKLTLATRGEVSPPAEPTFFFAIRIATAVTFSL